MTGNTRDNDALEDLRWHWGEAYQISAHGRQWEARRRDTSALLTASAPDSLRDQIITDYLSQPVPRDKAGQ